jgi:hypothetical protein
MNQCQFEELCFATSKALALPDVGELSRTGQIQLLGIAIGIFHDDDVDDAIHCYVDLGSVQALEREATFARALALNLSLDGANEESLGFDEDSSKLVLRSKIELDPAPTGEQMAEWFRDYSAFALAFQGNEGPHVLQPERDGAPLFVLA